jgi:hypothetical protein
MLKGVEPECDDFVAQLQSAMGFDEGEQDIHEFLAELINISMLHLRSNYVKLTPTMTCLECRTGRFNETVVDSIISIDPTCKSVAKGVEKVFKEELLHDINCEKCLKQCDTKRNYLLDLSDTEVCTVFIKKNQYNSKGEGRMILQKDTKNMVISNSLYLSDGNGEQKFDIFACIYHEGNAVSCFCFIKFI